MTLHLVKSVLHSSEQPQPAVVLTPTCACLETHAEQVALELLGLVTSSL